MENTKVIDRSAAMATIWSRYVNTYIGPYPSAYSDWYVRTMNARRLLAAPVRDYSPRMTLDTRKPAERLTEAPRGPSDDPERARAFRRNMVGDEDTDIECPA